MLASQHDLLLRCGCDLVAEALVVELHCVANRMRCIVKVTRRCTASSVFLRSGVQCRKASKAVGMVSILCSRVVKCYIAHPWSVV